MADAEAAVRKYLTFLEDPDQLVDPDEIERLEKAASDAGDPLTKLRALGALEKARQLDAESIRADFVSSAKAWAEQEGVPVTAFSRLGVPDDVLEEAGLLGSDRSRGRGRGGARRKGRSDERESAPRQRAKAVPVETIKSRVPDGKFTVRELEELSGGSPATVRKALSDLISSGAVEELGPATDWAGRGRAPVVYRRTSG